MLSQDEIRRKVISNNALKNNYHSSSYTNLMTNLQKRKSDLSKQKVKQRQMPEHVEQFDPKNSATICFRNVKNNIQNNNLKSQKDIGQPRIIKKNTNNEMTSPNGIQINVNIQNIMPIKKIQITQMLSERSLSQRKKRVEEKSTIKIKNTHQLKHQFKQFQCNEELEIKAGRIYQKKAFFAEHTITNDKYFKNKIEIQNPKANIHGEMNPEHEIQQFERRQCEINMIQQTENVLFLETRQACYDVDPLYIEKRQKNFNWTMRAILIDWMMHVAFVFKFKRQTMHIACILVDNYLQLTLHLPKSDFQLAGAAAMFIAAKIEEFQPLSSQKFAQSTNERFSSDEIKEMQVKLCKTLRFCLNPPTLYMWANRMMLQWDNFVEQTLLKDQYFIYHEPKYFKRFDEDSYKHYRQLLQILDCAILDIQTVQHKPKILACSLIYLILGKQFKEFNTTKIINEFSRTSVCFLEDNPFNNIFRYFLEYSFSLEMSELLPSVQYLATYFSLPLSYSRPCLEQDELSEEMHLEEFTSYQTYNPNMLATCKRRFRGIYQ